MRRGLNIQDLSSRFEQLPRAGRWWVAYSGGCDSHVLLHLMAELRAQLGFSLSAVYINHGLSPHAEDWARHCRQQAATLGIECAVLAVDGRPSEGESPEAAARNARYSALEALLDPGDVLFTAHHQRDQAETLMLQLLRGAGPKGLSAMPMAGRVGEVAVYRPLLDVAYDDIVAYANKVGLQWIEDESNLDTRFDRNYLRHQVMPVLAGRWPALDRMLSRSAQHCAEASDILRDVATDDLSCVQGEAQSQLSITKLSLLSRARQRNVVRHWLQGLGYALPSEIHLRQIVDEVMAAAVDAEPCVNWAGVEVRRYREKLYACRPLEVSADWASWHLVWEQVGAVELPDGRVLSESRQGRADLALSRDRLAAASPVLAFRQGGERIRPSGRAGSKSLKKLLQERAIPPWLRARVPLLFANGELIAVIGVCVAEGWQPQSPQDSLYFELRSKP